jgi:hypothetical protein
MTLMTLEGPLNMALSTRFIINSIHNFITFLIRQSTFRTQHFDNIYNLACRISYHNAFSDVVMSYVLKIRCIYVLLIEYQRTTYFDSN